MLLPVVTTHMAALAMPHHGDGAPYQSLIGSRNLRLEDSKEVRLAGWLLAAWSGHGKTCLHCLFAGHLNSDYKADIVTSRGFRGDHSSTIKVRVCEGEGVIVS